MPVRIRVSRKWLFLLLGVAAVKVLASFPHQVEKYYASGAYPFLAKIQRLAFGWLPFSVGDLLYIGFGFYLLWKAVRWFRSRGKGGGVGIRGSILNLIGGGMLIYLLFNILWGLNYDRLTPASRIGLAVPDSVSTTDLRDVTAILLERTNRFRPASMATYAEARDLAIPLFRAGGPVQVDPSSMKPSLFGILGNYMGYSGYYNPFSGEAQVNTYVPDFLVPFVTCHEIAHQAGYAKENEANFIGFLAARQSRDSSMLYSAYFNMFLYANGQLRRLDSAQARRNLDSLRPGPRADIKAYKAYLQAYDTPVGAFVDAFYDRFLRLNQQPAGSATYSRVILWIVAYHRKYGTL